MEQPIGHNPDRISDASLNIGLVLLIALGLIALAFGGPGVIVYFAILLVAGVLIAILAPRTLPVKLARGAATLLTLGLLGIELLSGLPRAVLDGLGPYAQNLHDEVEGGGWLALTLTIFVVGGVCLIAFFWSVKAWCSRSVPRILLSALVMAVVLAPLLGMGVQEWVRPIVQ